MRRTFSKGLRMDGCQVEGCTRLVSKTGHTFCLDHWKAERSGKITRCPTCQRWHDTAGPLRHSCKPLPATGDDLQDDSPAGYLSSTKIGKHFGLSNIKINLILAELGWIEKYVKGSVPTDRGNLSNAGCE